MKITTTETIDGITSVQIDYDADTPTLFGDLIHDYEYNDNGVIIEW